MLFDDNGVCNACKWAEMKDNEIDWEEKENELIKLCDSFRSKSGNYDCIIPVSGGKDSTFQTLKMLEFGMNPLCVTWAPFEWTNIGFKNLNAFVHSGFNNIIGQPDQKIHRINHNRRRISPNR